MLDFKMETFLMVCKYMNFTRAARELHITQPAVSSHIRGLEENYNTRLFDYRGKKLTLTKAGELLLCAARTLKHDEIHLREELDSLDTGKTTVTFGATLTVGEYVMPQTLARYLDGRPDLSVKMVVANTQELLRGIDNSDIDFAIVEGSFENSEYKNIVYSSEHFTAVAAPSYPFKRPVRTIEDLLGERLLLREPGSGTREILIRCLENRNLSIHDFSATLETNSIHAIKHLAEAGLGITFVYEAAVRPSIEAGKLVPIPLKDFKIMHNFNFIWRKGSIYSDYYLRLFRDFSGQDPADRNFPA